MELCETCAIGYYLPSGVCDHCDSRQPKPTAEELGYYLVATPDLGVVLMKKAVFVWYCPCLNCGTHPPSIDHPYIQELIAAHEAVVNHTTSPH